MNLSMIPATEANWLDRITKSGEKLLVSGFPFESYLDVTAASSHGLMTILKSPAHYKSAKDEPDGDQSPVLRFGRLAHTAQLEFDRYQSKKRIQPDFFGSRAKANIEKQEAWLIDLPPDAIHLTAEEDAKILKMVDALQRHPRAKKLLSDGVAEASGFWKDPTTGVVCKIRPDYLRPNGVVVDYKTASDARPKAFQWAAFNYRYHVQAGFYLEGLSQIMNAPVEDFSFVVQEKEPPYAVMVYVADDDFIRKGKVLARRALDIYAECIKKNIWPSYPAEIFNLSLPASAAYED